MLTVTVRPETPPEACRAARLSTTWSDDTGTVFARGRVGSDALWIEWPGLGVFRVRPPSTDVTAWPDPAVSVNRLIRVFERLVQPTICQALGYPVLHSSAVLGPRGVLAFCGLSGAGKSTIAYRLGQLGYPQIADDALVMRLSGDRVDVVELPFSPRLRPATLATLGSTSGPSTHRRSGGTLDGIVLLSQDEHLPTAIASERVPAYQAFSRVLTHAHSFDPDNPEEGARLTREYLRIVELVPVVAVTYRPDFSCLPALVDRILHVAAGVAPASAEASRTRTEHVPAPSA